MSEIIRGSIEQIEVIEIKAFRWNEEFSIEIEAQVGDQILLALEYTEEVLTLDHVATGKVDLINEKGENLVPVTSRGIMAFDCGFLCKVHSITTAGVYRARATGPCITLNIINLCREDPSGIFNGDDEFAARFVYKKVVSTGIKLILSEAVMVIPPIYAKANYRKIKEELKTIAVNGNFTEILNPYIPPKYLEKFLSPIKEAFELLKKSGPPWPEQPLDPVEWAVEKICS
jgi:hypothetical protein